MSVHDSRVGQPDDEDDADEPLELLTDEEDLWTIVPANADGDKRLTQWISGECEVFLDLEEVR